MPPWPACLVGCVAQAAGHAQRAVVPQIAPDFPNDHRHERAKSKNMLPRVRGTRRRAVDCVIYLDFSALQHDSVHARAHQRLPLSIGQTVPAYTYIYFVSSARPASSCRACCTACRTSSSACAARSRARRAWSIAARSVSSSPSAYSSYSRRSLRRPDRARAGRRPRLPPRRRAARARPQAAPGRG